MSQVTSDNVITSLRRQLSEAHLKIAVLEAQLMEMGTAQPAQEATAMGSEGQPEG